MVRPTVNGCAVFVALIPALVCGSVMALEPFTEEAMSRGIQYFTGSATFGTGVAVADLDNDGLLDLVVVGEANGDIGIYRNLGAGQFQRMPDDPGIPVMNYPSGVVAGDYDADGDLDLYITATQGPNVLVRNDGQMQFSDVTALAQVGDTQESYGAAWADTNGDGWLDLFVGNYTYGSGEPNRMYLNAGDRTFVDILDTCGINDSGMTFQPVFFDSDRDGDSDLYVSNDRCGVGQSNRLWENVDGSFIDATDSSGTGACMFSMGVAVGDFDRNGLQDLYVANLQFGNRLYLDQGDGSYLESSELAGVESFSSSWGTLFFDLDNDSHLELYVANEGWANHLYDHDGVWPSVDLAAAYHVNEYSRGSFGVAVGDIDLDGDLDMFLSNKNDRIRLFINHEGENRNWVKLRMVGQGRNTFAVGGVADIRTGTVWQTREVIAGSNYKSQNSLLLHYGLDTETTIDELQILWPGGTTRTLTDLAANRTWAIYPPEQLGDADSDGVVDLDDLELLSSCLQTGTFEPGCELMDLDGNGFVGSSDLSDFLRRYSGPFFDCDQNGTMDASDITEVSAGSGIPDGCQTFDPSIGDVPGLALDRLPGGELQLSWSDACGGTPADYTIYQGELGRFDSHVPLQCSTNNATSETVTPVAGSSYYLIVPNNDIREGSYGNDSFGPREPGAGSCYAQLVGSCE